MAIHDPKSRYYLPISSIGGAGLPDSVVRNAMEDGRMASWWYQLILAHHFTNLQLVDERGRDFVTRDSRSLSYEQRSLPLNANNLFLSLSAHQGAKRSYDRDEFEENTKRNSGTIVVIPWHDYTNLLIATLPQRHILKYAANKGQMSREDLYRYLGNPQALYRVGRRLADGKTNELIVLP